MDLSSPLFLLFICGGLVAAVYGATLWQQAKDRTAKLRQQFGRGDIDISKTTAIGAIILIGNLVVYLLLYYVGIYFSTGEWPAFGFHAPIFVFLLVINIGFGASYHLGWWSVTKPSCPAHGEDFTRGCMSCEKLVSDGQVKFKDNNNP